MKNLGGILVATLYDFFLTDDCVIAVDTSGSAPADGARLKSLEGGIPVPASYDFFLTDDCVIAVDTSGSASSTVGGRSSSSSALSISCKLTVLLLLDVGIVLAMLMVITTRDRKDAYIRVVE